MKKLKLITLLLLCILSSCKKTESTKNNKNDKQPGNVGLVEATSSELVDVNLSQLRLMGSLPSSFELNMPPVGSQGQQGSCVSWATAYGGNSYFKHIQDNTNYTNQSNLCSPKYIYNQIVRGSCTGTSYPANFNLLINKGACSLQSMPYNDTECTLQPNNVQEQEAALQRLDRFELVDKSNISGIKNLLFSGQPIFIAVNVDASFDALNISNPIWSSASGIVRGGHALILVGWDDNKGNGAFKVQNSWGSSWGDQGFLWIDYNFFPNSVIGSECYTAYPAPDIDPNTNINSGLIAHYTFDNSVLDYSGNSNHGTLQGIVTGYSTGRIGNALEFIGSTSSCCDNLGTHVLIPNLINSTMAAFTISMWVNETSMSYYHGENYISFGDAYNGGVVAIAHHLNELHSTAMSLQYTVGMTATTNTPAQNYLDLVYDNSGNNQWVLYTLVYSNGIMYSYRNDKFQASVPNQIVSVGNTKAGIGIHWFDWGTGGVATRFNGKMDDVRIYNRALTHAEVAEIFNQ